MSGVDEEFQRFIKHANREFVSGKRHDEIYRVPLAAHDERVRAAERERIATAILNTAEGYQLIGRETAARIARTPPSSEKAAAS